jgi:hypothetical protein
MLMTPGCSSTDSGNSALVMYCAVLLNLCTRGPAHMRTLLSAKVKHFSARMCW